ncbi:MAG: glycosyltransferase family 4 protein [Phycisphaeraceae bacterium]|nr:glycosyltransferase family 4 protein [Phycisphaeraceae bacterium]
MNILQICYEYPPLGGGGGIGASQYAEAWARAGHKVTVLTAHGKGLPKFENLRGVEVIRVSCFGRKQRATATFLTMGIFVLSAMLYGLFHRSKLKQRADVINTHFSIPTGPAAHFIARWLGVPNVLTIIGGDIYDPSKKSSPHRSAPLRAVNRWVIGKADHVVAISSDTKKRAIEHYQITRDIQVINYGFRPTPPPPPEVLPEGAATITKPNDGIFRLISVGRLVKRKGFNHLVRAMKKLPRDVQLSIVGDGPLDAELKQLAAQEHVADRVHLLGYQSRESIYRLLRQSDCYVLSSLHEGLGIVVQEAMEAGLPVVATDNGGQVDLIHEPRNGLLVPIENADRIAEAVMKIRDNPALAADMGRHNQQDIAELHIDHNCKLYLDAFERAMAR